MTIAVIALWFLILGVVAIEAACGVFAAWFLKKFIT